MHFFHRIPNKTWTSSEDRRRFVFRELHFFPPNTHLDWTSSEDLSVISGGECVHQRVSRCCRYHHEYDRRRGFNSVLGSARPRRHAGLPHGERRALHHRRLRPLPQRRRLLLDDARPPVRRRRQQLHHRQSVRHRHDHRPVRHPLGRVQPRQLPVKGGVLHSSGIRPLLLSIFCLSPGPPDRGQVREHHLPVQAPRHLQTNARHLRLGGNLDPLLPLRSTAHHGLAQDSGARGGALQLSGDA